MSHTLMLLVANLAAACAYSSLFGPLRSPAASARPVLPGHVAASGHAAGLLWSHSARPEMRAEAARSLLARVKMQAAAASAGSDEGAEAKGGPFAKLRARLPPPAELKKVVPLGAMLFFILFAYTILRDTKVRS